jgi:hypothetical protein
MPPGRPPGVTHEASVPYKSSACYIGTHGACTQSSPTAPPIDAPLIYETCGCGCHSRAAGGSAQEVTQ